MVAKRTAQHRRSKPSEPTRETVRQRLARPPAQSTRSVAEQPVEQSSEPVAEQPLGQASEQNIERPTNRRAEQPSPQRGGQAMNSRRIKRTISSFRRYGVIAFGAIMIVGCIVGLLFFLRPTISENENRYLTAFPNFTTESFLNGAYFTQVSLWYADTYPLREPMVSTSRAMQSLFGMQPDESMTGAVRQSDEIPTDSTSDAKPTHEHNVKPPENGVRAADLEDQVTDNVYKYNGACYTLYYFDQDASDEYAGVINDAAALLKDEGVTVYSILLPTNGGVMLDNDKLDQLGVPHQDQAIDYFYSRMTDDVVTVPTFDTLREHRDEYLYFRTDFHWTQLAAYYVYESFCKTKGIEPAPFDEWETLVFSPYVGEYSAMQDLSGIEPDSVEAHIPQGTNTMKYWVDDLNPSSEMEGPVVADYSDADDDDINKYNCFVCGNRPLSVIENPNVTDGSSCLVIKDSFGNPLVATMVDSYQYIYTMDFRYTSQKLVDFVREHNIQDVIFENVIMFAGTYDCVDLLSGIVYPDETTNTNDEGKSSEASASSEAANA